MTSSTRAVPKPLNLADLVAMPSDRERGRALQRHLSALLLADADDPDIGTPPTLMKVAAAADAACVSAQTIRNWARRSPIGTIDPVTGVALINRQALRVYLEGRFGMLPVGLRDE